MDRQAPTRRKTSKNEDSIVVDRDWNWNLLLLGILSLDVSCSLLNKVIALTYGGL